VKNTVEMRSKDLAVLKKTQHLENKEIALK
jgi:hypothetical protein